MKGHELYAHYWDCLYCETKEEAPDWEDLSVTEREGWIRLAQCVTEQRGCTIAWQLPKERVGPMDQPDGTIQ